MGLDVEAAMLDFLADLGATFTVTPLNLADILPAIRVGRIGGPRDDTEDHPNLDIQTYMAADPANPRASLDLGNAICARILATLYLPGAGTVDEPVCTTAPVFIPYPNGTLSVTRAQYRLTLRY